MLLTVVVMLGTLFNAIGNDALGFSKFGFPRMELAGLGLGTLPLFTSKRRCMASKNWQNRSPMLVQKLLNWLVNEKTMAIADFSSPLAAQQYFD